jgi:uncharacterized protein YjiK
MKLKHLIFAIAVASCASAQATDSINLGNYTVTGIFALDPLNGTSGGISGLEASGVTYARDRGTLFFVGDEGTGVVEISRTGQTISNNLFDWTGTGSTKHDTEGLTYMGNGVLVVGEERLQDAYQFSYVAGATVTLANNFVSISNTSVGNNGMEGISYDPRGTGSFVTIKQQSPEDILAGKLTFAAPTGPPPAPSGDGASPPGGGTSTMTQLFDPTLMGLDSLSDVQTLSPVDALAGTPGADNILVLSLASRRLIEVTRTGTILSSFDLTHVLAHNAIEGVTVDENGTIYLVAEQIQDGSPSDGKSQLIVLSNVPEPGTWILMVAGLGVMGAATYRRKKSAQ